MNELLPVLLPRAQLVSRGQISSCGNMLHKVEPSFTFCNNFFQLATLKFVVRQVEHTVGIRQQLTVSTIFQKTDHVNLSQKIEHECENCVLLTNNLF